MWNTPYLVYGNVTDNYPLTMPFNISAVSIQLPAWLNTLPAPPSRYRPSRRKTSRRTPKQAPWQQQAPHPQSRNSADNICSSTVALLLATIALRYQRGVVWMLGKERIVLFCVCFNEVSCCNDAYELVFCGDW